MQKKPPIVFGIFKLKSRVNDLLLIFRIDAPNDESRSRDHIEKKKKKKRIAYILNECRN